MLTLHMIVRDEEKLLPQCLKSVRDWVDEIVIVDTGSSDNTVDVAKSFGGTVRHFDWIDDFSAARNYALGSVKTPWTLWLDADDVVLNPELLPKITQETHKQRGDAIWSIYKQDEACFQRRLQLFKPKHYEWKGFVHENPIPRRPHDSSSVLSDLVVLHRKPKERASASARKYLDILLDKDSENWFGLAESYKFLSILPDDPAKENEYADLADAHYWKAYEHPQANDQTKYVCLFHCVKLNIQKSQRNEQYIELAHRMAQTMVAMCPNRAEGWVLLGNTWDIMGATWNAVEAYQQAQTKDLPNDIGLVFQEYYSHIPKLLLQAIKTREEAKREPLIVTPKNAGLVLPNAS